MIEHPSSLSTSIRLSSPFTDDTGRSMRGLVAFIDIERNLDPDVQLSDPLRQSGIFVVEAAIIDLQLLPISLLFPDSRGYEFLRSA